MKNKILVLAFVVGCLALSAWGTTAYFTHEDTATNVITAGDVAIELQETAVPEGGGDPVPFEDVIGVMPGTEVSKIVEVKNTGGNAAWVRIILDKDILLADGAEGEVDLSLISCDLNTEYWTEKEGCYYYNTALEPGKTTEPLFTKVMFAQTMSNMYQHSKAVIQVDAQATQTANNGTTVFDAVGWPDAE